MTAFERRSVISGIGQSDIGRRLGRTGLDLTIDAALEAIADAGLTPADIDGIATYPGAGGGAGPGFSGPGTPEVQDALRLRVGWHSGGIEGAAQLAAVINAALNPKAVYRDAMTLDDYFASRVITTPFRLYDCDAPVDGSTAVVVSVAGHATAVDHPVAGVEAVGTALRGRPSWDQFDDMTTMAARDAGAQLWERTDLTPADVDVAELYDGFSFLAMTWLEALGFCGRGESGPFVEGGERIALDGALPLNTDGGQLSGGRLHGFGFVHEACLQLRGEAGGRAGAGPPGAGGGG